MARKNRRYYGRDRRDMDDDPPFDMTPESEKPRPVYQRSVHRDGKVNKAEMRRRAEKENWRKRASGAGSWGFAVREGGNVVSSSGGRVVDNNAPQIETQEQQATQTATVPSAKRTAGLGLKQHGQQAQAVQPTTLIDQTRIGLQQENPLATWAYNRTAGLGLSEMSQGDIAAINNHLRQRREAGDTTAPTGELTGVRVMDDGSMSYDYLTPQDENGERIRKTGTFSNQFGDRVRNAYPEIYGTFDQRMKMASERRSQAQSKIDLAGERQKQAITEEQRPFEMDYKRLRNMDFEERIKAMQQKNEASKSLMAQIRDEQNSMKTAMLASVLGTTSMLSPDLVEEYNSMFGGDDGAVQSIKGAGERGVVVTFRDGKTAVVDKNTIEGWIAKQRLAEYDNKEAMRRMDEGDADGARRILHPDNTRSVAAAKGASGIDPYKKAKYQNLLAIQKELYKEKLKYHPEDNAEEIANIDSQIARIDADLAKIEDGGGGAETEQNAGGSSLGFVKGGGSGQGQAAYPIQRPGAQREGFVRVRGPSGQTKDMPESEAEKWLAIDGYSLAAEQPVPKTVPVESKPHGAVQREATDIVEEPYDVRNRGMIPVRKKGQTLEEHRKEYEAWKNDNPWIRAMNKAKTPKSEHSSLLPPVRKANETTGQYLARYRAWKRDNPTKRFFEGWRSSPGTKPGKRWDDVVKGGD